MLAREYCEFPDVKKKKRKPIILSHHMLMGLKAGQAKMSKSDPESAIFMEDEAVRAWHVLCSYLCACIICVHVFGCDCPCLCICIFIYMCVWVCGCVCVAVR
jgi:hypothetical protein